jgi:hypothetical protein
MGLAIAPGDVLTQISSVFYSIWPILSIGLALLATPFIIKITSSIFAGDVNIGDNFRVWNWRRKGWMDKNSHTFTDKMLREYKPPRKRRR